MKGRLKMKSSSSRYRGRVLTALDGTRIAAFRPRISQRFAFETSWILNRKNRNPIRWNGSKIQTSRNRNPAAISKETSNLEPETEAMEMDVKEAEHESLPTIEFKETRWMGRCVSKSVLSNYRILQVTLEEAIEKMKNVIGLLSEQQMPTNGILRLEVRRETKKDREKCLLDQLARRTFRFGLAKISNKTHEATFKFLFSSKRYFKRYWRNLFR